MTTIVPIKATSSRKKVVLIHGFNGDSHRTFGMMPAFLAGDPALRDWDLLTVGYPSSLRPDLTGIWSADPGLANQGELLARELLHRYPKDRLAIVAHSMGGLIAQHAIVSSKKFRDATSHLFMYGTPSRGLKKTALIKMFKRQARDMAPKGRFIKQLRKAWKAMFPRGKAPFVCRSIAGVRDEFVPESSSLTAFPKSQQVLLAGNHLEIVKPALLTDRSVRLIVDGLTGRKSADAAPSRVTPDSTKPRTLVAYAKQLEASGRVAQAVAFLDRHAGINHYIPAAAGGILKRRWLAETQERQSRFGRQALGRYAAAFKSALNANRFNAAGYAGINSAFLTLALDDDRTEADRIAASAYTAHLKSRRPNEWRKLVAAEYHLHHQEWEKALANYAKGLPIIDNPSERANAVRQGVWTARLLDRDDIAYQVLGIARAV